MRISSRRAALAASCLLLFACSSRVDHRETSSSSSGGCGGSWDFGSSGSGSNVRQAPTGGSDSLAPSQPAPTGQAWKPTLSDDGCGRNGVQWVLVDEVCSDGEGTDPRSLEVPMFRDGAIVGGHLLAVDATHLWSLDLQDPTKIARSALLTGVGQPLSVQSAGSRLFIAAGLEGLVVVDATNPAAPARSASLDLPYAAFDVALHDSTAYVAMGKAGIAAVDVAGAPTLVKSMPLGSGYAAGVATTDSHLYVAACTGFSVLDRATGTVKATVPFPKNGDRLLAPAKDVAIVGDVAFVAAGSQGAVAIDITTPASPKIIGRCGITDPMFYASGVRAEGNVVFVAGGEWGILRIDASSPKSACTTPLVTAPPSKPSVDCSAQPPWEVVDWERVWTAPPPGRDPIQVLPAGEKVYAFGDARRIGVRAVDVRASGDLAKLLRYDEPRTLTSLAGWGSRLVAAGARGGVFVLETNGSITRATATGEEVLSDAAAVSMLSDGRFVALDSKGMIRVEGVAEPLNASDAVSTIDAHDLTVFGVSDYRQSVVRFELDGARTELSGLGTTARLPVSLASGPNGVHFAAPEWVASMSVPYAGAKLSPTVNAAQKTFDHDDIMDANLWRVRVPRRHLAGNAGGVVELAALASRAGITFHRTTGAPIEIALPAMTYAGLAADAQHAYAIGIDRGLYRSYLVTVALEGTPRVLSVEAFTGAASGVVALGNRVVVADADGEFRSYSVTGDTVAPLAVTRVEVKP